MQRSGRIVAAAGFTLALGWGNALEAQATGPVAVAQHTEAVVLAPPPVTNQVTASITAGATINSGNTDAYTGNAGGRFGLIRGSHQFTAEVLGTLGALKAEGTSAYEKTSANVIGRARYDRFLSENDALFVAVAPRRDTFAGLNIRLQMQAGYSRNLFFPSEDHRLWTELGYDLTYDDFAKTTVTTTDLEGGPFVDGSPTPILRPDVTATYSTSTTSDPGHAFVHSARAFLGYKNAITPLANLNLGVEGLFDVEDAKNVRVNAMADITTSVSKSFKLGVLSRLFYDHVPVPGKGRTDLMMAVNLIYTFDTLAAAPAEPAAVEPAAEPCDCSSAVDAAKAECAALAAPSEVPAAEAAPAAASPETAPVDAPATEAAAPAVASAAAPVAPAPAAAPVAPAAAPVAPAAPAAP